jgi:hypothetical protein
MSQTHHHSKHRTGHTPERADPFDTVDHPSVVKGIPQWLLTDIVDYAAYKRTQLTFGTGVGLHNRPHTVNHTTAGTDHSNRRKAESKMNTYKNWTQESQGRWWAQGHADRTGSAATSYQPLSTSFLPMEPTTPNPIAASNVQTVNNVPLIPSKPVGNKRSVPRGRNPNRTKKTGDQTNTEDGDNRPETDTADAITDVDTKSASDQINSLHADQLAAKRNLLTFYVTMCYFRKLRRRKHMLWNRLSKAFTKLQRMFRLKRLIRRTRKSTEILSKTLFFRIQFKVSVKRRAANRITKFISDFFKIRTQVVIKRYLMKVRTCQRCIRGFLAVHRARILLLEHYWDRMEKKLIRNIDKDEERMELIRRKEIEKLIMKADVTGVNLKWMLVENKVKALMSKMSKVQGRSEAFEKHCRVFADKQQHRRVQYDLLKQRRSQQQPQQQPDSSSKQTSARPSTTQGSRAHPGSRGKLLATQHDEKAVVEDSESGDEDTTYRHIGHVDRATRRQIIVKHISLKRKLFVERNQLDHGLSVDTNNKKGKCVSLLLRPNFLCNC